MPKAFKKFLLLAGIFSLASCVVVQDDSVDTSYRDEICADDLCSCSISVADLCTFDWWNDACNQCYEGKRFHGRNWASSTLGVCSTQEACALCRVGYSACSYPRTYWRVEFGPPPPPQRPHFRERHHRGRDGRDAPPPPQQQRPGGPQHEPPPPPPHRR